MAPRCGQPSWDYWSGADVSISSRHHCALSQPPTITRSLSPWPGLPSSPPTHPPWTRPRCEPSQICQMMASSCRMAPRYLVPAFFALPHPSVKPAPPEKSPPSPHCRLFHLLRFLSLPSLCLILVCASACHIKGEPGVREPQAWNINAANCMAVWEINPLKIAPYTSWTHHHSLIRIAPYRNSPRLLWAITQVSKFRNIREVFRNVFLKCDKSGVIWDGCCFPGQKRGPTRLSSSQCICARGRRRIGKTKCQRKALLSKCENNL